MNVELIVRDSLTRRSLNTGNGIKRRELALTLIVKKCSLFANTTTATAIRSAACPVFLFGIEC